MKKTLTALGIVTIIFFLGYAGLLCYSCVVSSSSDFVKFFMEDGKGIIANFTGLFTNWEDFVKFDLNNGFFDIYRYIAFALVALVAILAIVWLIVALCKKRPALIGWLPVIILFALPAALTLCSFHQYLDIFKKNEELTKVLINYFVVGLAGVTLLLGLAFFVVGMVAMSKKQVEAKEEAEEVVPEDLNEGLSEAEDATASLAADIPEPTVEEPVVTFDTPEPEPVPTYVPTEVEPEPEPEMAESVEKAVEVEPLPAEEEVKAEPVTPAAPAIDVNTLAASLRDVVRDIVRDELARAELNKKPEPTAPVQTGTTSTCLTGATFGGPLVVQYFNGGIQGVTPVETSTPAPAPASPVVQEVKAAPAPLEKPVEEKPAPAPKAQEKPAPVPTPVVTVEPAPAPAAPAEVEKKVYDRISFTERMLNADKETQDNYNALKNEIMSYGVKSRVSNSGDTFRLHKKTYVKITIAGKSLKLYFALDPKAYADTTMPIQDASDKAIYEEIPLVFKVRSELSFRRCKQLIQDVMDKDNLEQGEIDSINWVKELKASLE